jgi:hypothetical protein
MLLTQSQRQVLLISAKIGEVNFAIRQLRHENPDAFHTAESLQQRVFVYEPKQGEPCRMFFRAASAEPDDSPSRAS